MHLQKKTKKQKSKTISHPWLHFQIIGFGREKKINVSTSWSLWIHKLKGSICTYPPVLSVCGVCRCYHLTMQIDPIPYTHLSNRMYKSLCWASKQCRALTNSKGSFPLPILPPYPHLSSPRCAFTSLKGRTNFIYKVTGEQSRGKEGHTNRIQ